MNSLLTDEEKIEKLEKKRAYHRNYMNEYHKKNDRTLWDLITRQKPEYHQRELLRLKNKRLKLKQHMLFRNNIPHYLTE